MKSIFFYRFTLKLYHNVLILLTAFILLFGISCANGQKSNVSSDPERQWTGYRGSMASGVFDNANLPDVWDVKSGKNIKWTVDIPGLGLSCPVIWGNKVFITTAISSTDNSGLKPGIFGNVEPVGDNSEHEWKVFCFDKNNGRLNVRSCYLA